MVPRTVGSEATNTIKLFVDNNSGSDTSAVCHETTDTAADAACHRLPKSTETTFAQIFPIISANCRFIVGEINKPVLASTSEKNKQKLIFVCVISVCLACNEHAVQGKLAFFNSAWITVRAKHFFEERHKQSNYRGDDMESFRLARWMRLHLTGRKSHRNGRNRQQTNRIRVKW